MPLDERQDVEASLPFGQVPEVLRLPDPEGPGSDHHLQGHRPPSPPTETPRAGPTRPELSEGLHRENGWSNSLLLRALPCIS